MLRKIVIVQCETGQQLSLEDNLLIFKHRPHFVVLPEYYNVNPVRRDTERNASEGHELLKYCATLSDRFETTLIAGTAIESDGRSFYNTSTVFRHGQKLISYRKINPTINERKNGITPGTEPISIEIDGVVISIMICADVLEPINFTHLKKHQPDVVFIPTTSPARPRETVKEKQTRDEQIFVAGSQSCGAFLVKCCAIGTLWSGALQGRSLVCAPWGIISRMTPVEENKKRILSVVLNIDELREFRHKQDALINGK
ncbi:MAG: carbon-nitrogen hydrolase family protein [candidate division Zixibacteria bacterium]|nr:carbon-nitrogen hydrolase family protein [candidate division Zixibacteria bacterium]